jgi:GGDEF domain-containing protein
VVRIVDTIQVITGMILLQQKLERLATTDELTGATNRRQLFTFADQLCQLAKRYNTPFSIIFYDLDHFKAVNDTYGHAAGDEVLRQTTATIQAMLRDTDILPATGVRISVSWYRKRIATKPTSLRSGSEKA